MAVRVTSEDANDGFKPTCGSIDELSFRTSPDVWGYFSVKSGGGIHEFSDSQVQSYTDPIPAALAAHTWAAELCYNKCLAKFDLQGTMPSHAPQHITA